MDVDDADASSSSKVILPIGSHVSPSPRSLSSMKRTTFDDFDDDDAVIKNHTVSVELKVMSIAIV